MSILSLRFLAFVIILVCLYYVIPKRFRWGILLLASLYFYYLSSGKYIVFIISSSFIIYLLGLVLTKINDKTKNLKELDLEKSEIESLKKKLNKKKKLLVFFGVIINLFFLVATKYSNFALFNINHIFNINLNFSITKILIPLGISYYTLEAISYLVDVYRGKYKASKNIFKVLLYLIYFPKIIEGPITKYNDFEEELSDNKLDFSKITVGLDLIIFGLFKKMVIADRAGIFVNQAFSINSNGFTIIMSMILYTVQIYAEFSGCIDIMRGVSLLFGIRLPLNFKRPFFSKSIQEFWQRWHISLGSWIREYVFFPISFSKLNMKVNTFSKNKFNNYLYKFIIVAFPLFFVWFVNGIWHGASYKYIMYGLYYYFVMMVGLLLKPLTDRIIIKLKLKDSYLKYFRILRTCLLVVIGMTLFRASSISEFVIVIGNVFSKGNGILTYGLVKIDFVILLVCNIVIFVISLLEEKKVINIEEGFTNNPILRAMVYTLLICTVIILGIYGEGYDASKFIYGAF